MGRQAGQPARVGQRDTLDLRFITLDGGRFTAGSNDYYPEEAPAHEREVGAFALAASPVTVGQFAAFVADTGYDSDAEKPLDISHYPDLTPEQALPGSLVTHMSAGPVDLTRPEHWWDFVPGANWRYPHGPDGPLADATHPVTHVSFDDARAFASWYSRVSGIAARLPEESELEFAAGLHHSAHPDRSRAGTSQRPRINRFYGAFPYDNQGAGTTTPVGASGVDALGFADLIGNVWEWTTTVWGPHARSDAAHTQAPPKSCCGGGVSGIHSAEVYVVKGGSYWCSPDYCLRYRPAARQPQERGATTGHLGFRLAHDLDG